MDISKIEIEVEELSVTTAEIDDEIDRMADAFRPYKPKEGCCRRGDRLVMDYRAAEFPDLVATDIKFVDGSNTMWPGMDEQLEGIQAGETRRVKILFQPDFAIPEIAGREIEIDVTVRAVEAPAKINVRKGCKWSDDLARRFGWKNATEFRAKVRDRIVERYKPVLEGRAVQRLFKAAKIDCEATLDRLCDAEKVEATEADLTSVARQFWEEQWTENPTRQDGELAEMPPPETPEQILARIRGDERICQHIRRKKTVDRLLAKVKKRKCKVRRKDLEADDA